MKTIFSIILILAVINCPLSFAKGSHGHSRSHSGKNNSHHGVKLVHHAKLHSEKISV